MMNRVICVTLALLLTAFPCLAESARVFDDADILTVAQEQNIEKHIRAFQSNTGVDFVVLTSDSAHDGIDQQQIADEYYIQGGFGLNEEHSGVLYYIDMHERYQYLMSTGVMIDYMTDARADNAIAKVTKALSSGNYTQACLSMIDEVERCFNAGIPEGQYRYDEETGMRLDPEPL